MQPLLLGSIFIITRLMASRTSLRSLWNVLLSKVYLFAIQLCKLGSCIFLFQGLCGPLSEAAKALVMLRLNINLLE